VSYLNWLPNRPYTGGDKYNCLQIIAELDTANTSTTLLNQAKVGDAECLDFEACSVCRVDHNVRYLLAWCIYEYHNIWEILEQQEKSFKIIVKLLKKGLKSSH